MRNSKDSIGDSKQDLTANPSNQGMKSLAKVMASQEMGYGLGPSRQSTSLHSKAKVDRMSRLSGVSAGSLLATSSHHSRHSIGQTIPIPLRISMARDAVSGVEYLHSKGLLHCDIKSLNFLGMF